MLDGIIHLAESSMRNTHYLCEAGPPHTRTHTHTHTTLQRLPPTGVKLPAD